MSMNKMSYIIDEFLNQQKSSLEIISKDTSELIKLIDVLIKARKKNYRIFTMGNGGSGSTASHFVSDLLKTAITKENNRFDAISLIDNIPVLSAWSNDVSYDDIFLEQLKNYLKKNDILIGFSGSGKSKNIIKSLQYAKKNGAMCIGFTGKTGGYMKKYCDICIRVPSKKMLTIESQHLLLCHCIVSALRQTGTPLFKYD